ncbi:MAG: hypothetical protein AAF387_10680 [Pseudomonadota bacterium]
MCLGKQSCYATPSVTFFLCWILFSQGALAHGGVAMEDDLCIMRIGQYRAHFTGYQPRLRASQEFCEDIPELGEAIIVLDFLDSVLRKKQISFQVISDPSGKGATAAFEDIESALSEGTHNVHSIPSDVYPSGSFNATISINKPGWYVGVLSAAGSDDATPLISVFPFSVGVRDYTNMLSWIAVIVFLSGAFYWLSARRRSE